MHLQKNEEFFDGFCWAIPQAFATPLSGCRFELGDILYDTRLAYEGEWKSALGHIHHSVELKWPMRGGTARVGEDQDSMFADNWNSRVEFTLRDYKDNTERHVATTQGRLYRLLWKGNIADFETIDAGLPLPARELLRRLPDTVSRIHEHIPETTRQGGVFLTPYDTAEQRLWAKTRTIHEALRHLDVKSGLVELGAAGVQDAELFAPTVRVAWFAMANKTQGDDLEQALKRHLHKPAKNKKTDKEVFYVHRHGHFVPAN
jgi:hypothetical protein